MLTGTHALYHNYWYSVLTSTHALYHNYWHSVLTGTHALYHNYWYSVLTGTHALYCALSIQAEPMNEKLLFFILNISLLQTLMFFYSIIFTLPVL